MRFVTRPHALLLLGLLGCGATSHEAPPAGASAPDREPGPAAEPAGGAELHAPTDVAEPSPEPVAAGASEAADSPVEVEAPPARAPLRLRAFPELAGALDIGADATRICAVLGSGAVQCSDVVTGESAPLPFASPPQDVVQLSIGSEACVLSRRGRVACVGVEEDGRVHEHAPTGLRDVASIAQGGIAACALERAGGVRCWNGAERARPVRGVAGMTAISSAAHSTCGLREDGAVHCWVLDLAIEGCSDCGYAGSPPAAVEGVADVRALAGAGAVQCALATEGTVVCWGSSPFEPPRARSVAGATAIEHIAAFAECGPLHRGGARCVGATCGVRADGTVLAWGSERALAAHDEEASVVGVLPGAVELAVGARFVCARSDVGDVHCLVP